MTTSCATCRIGPIKLELLHKAKTENQEHYKHNWIVVNITFKLSCSFPTNMDQPVEEAVTIMHCKPNVLVPEPTPTYKTLAHFYVTRKIEMKNF